MRFNESWLKQLAKLSNPEKEGILEYKAPRESYRQRLFRLRGNLLFYFRISDRGVVESEPLGVMVVEGCDVQMEEVGDRPFVFSIVFPAEGGRKHYLSGQMFQHCQDWVLALKTCSHSFISSKMEHLRRELFDRTGKDYYEDLVANKVKDLKLPSSTKQPVQGRKSSSLPRSHVLPASDGIHRHAQPGSRENKSNSTFFAAPSTRSSCQAFN